MPHSVRLLALFAFLGAVSTFLSVPHRKATAVEPESDVLAGHSFHGEVFNEGPRQAAYLMAGMGNVEFPASTESALAQKFINQGVAQLHGFWYYEAERSFRQAAVLDPDCAIAYWGMAMANTGNMERARGFMQEAVERISGVTRREKLHIEAYDQYCKKENDKGKVIEKKDRAKQYTLDLEEIVEEFPDDVEARAFLALQLWQNGRADLPIVSHVAINSVIQDVFDVNPMHPAHHYRIHLWDGHKPQHALESAARCGPSLPGIAHMWHMPGHTYDKLHRYHDAVWQQEASARVDHAHMIRDRVMPDQIHNFAHNNEWLIRNLVKIGRVNDGLSLAKNMLELPRHPDYNTLKKGSTKFGRERLWLVLSSYRLWPELIELADTMYLEPTDDPLLQLERLKYLGVAYALNGQNQNAETMLSALQERFTESQDELAALEEQAKQDESSVDDGGNKKNSQKAAANRERRKKEREQTTKQLKDRSKQLEKAIKSVEIAMLACQEKWDAALAEWEQSDLSDNLLKAEWLLAAGKTKDCMDLLDKEIKSKSGQLLPLAVKAHAIFVSEGAFAARETFEKTRELAAAADLNTPLLARLAPLAAELEFAPDWRAEFKPADDVGERPELDSLGPFRWSPYMAPDFNVANSSGGTLHLKNLSGKPTLVIFYLGFGCLHCVEQLHEFSPRAKDFRDSGIDIIAISSENLESLNTGLSAYSKPLDIPLHADPELTAFQAFRCFDNFEQQPLHGTFLMDPDGHVLWQDISYEPFMDVEFTMQESHRLLTLAGFAELLHVPQTKKRVETASNATP